MTAMTFAATAHNHASTDNAFNPDTQRIKSHLFFLADDLLEGRQRIDRLVEYDQLASSRIDTGSHQL